MAKVTITIEDSNEGKVKVTVTPTFETMMRMVASGGHDLTSAHGYAISALNRIRENSKSNEPTNAIILPKGRGLI